MDIDDRNTRTSTLLLPRGAFEVSKLSVPGQIGVEGDCLVWRWRTLGGPVQGKLVDASTTSLLNHFIDINSPRKVDAFARKFGNLGTCRHGHFVSHGEIPTGMAVEHFRVRPDDKLLPAADDEPVARGISKPESEKFYCEPEKREDGSYVERIDEWLMLSRGMRAVLDTTKRLKDAQRPLREDIESLLKIWDHTRQPRDDDQEPMDASDFFDRDNKEGLRAGVWQLILDLLNRWLAACPLRLWFANIGGRVDFNMSFLAGDERGCFPALVYELVTRVRGETGKLMVPCSHCGYPFPPSREPADGRRSFCPTCQKEGWPQRYANRDAYKQNREKILKARKEQRKQRKRER